MEKKMCFSNTLKHQIVTDDTGQEHYERVLSGLFTAGFIKATCEEQPMGLDIGRNKPAIRTFTKLNLIEGEKDRGKTPLMEAASGNFVGVGKDLLRKGADVNASVPSSRDTALTIAADKGHYRFVELLLSRNAAVDVKNKKGNSPLWLACNGGHLEVVQLLVSAGADIDSQDNRRVSCLMSSFREGHVEVCVWMVKHVNQFPSDQELSRYIAKLSDEVLQKKCQQCMEIIMSAEDKQAEEAFINANALLEELDKERQHEENKKAAAAIKRERKKKKKKEKEQEKDFPEKEEGEKNQIPMTPPPATVVPIIEVQNGENVTAMKEEGWKEVVRRPVSCKFKKVKVPSSAIRCGSGKTALSTSKETTFDSPASTIKPETTKQPLPKNPEQVPLPVPANVKVPQQPGMQNQNPALFPISGQQNGCTSMPIQFPSISQICSASVPNTNMFQQNETDANIDTGHVTAVKKGEYTKPSQPMTLPKLEITLNPNAPDFTPRHAEPPPNHPRGNKPPYNLAIRYLVNQQGLAQQPAGFSPSVGVPTSGSTVPSGLGIPGQTPVPPSLFSPLTQGRPNSAPLMVWMPRDGDAPCPIGPLPPATPLTVSAQLPYLINLEEIRPVGPFGGVRPLPPIGWERAQRRTQVHMSAPPTSTPNVADRNFLGHIGPL